MQKLYLDLKKKSRKRIPLQRMTYKIAFLVIRRKYVSNNIQVKGI